MKLNKIMLGAAALAAGTMAFADVKIGGKVEYTNNAVEQDFTKTGDGDWEHSDASATFDPDGYSKVDVKVNAANFEFNLGLKISSSAGDEGLGKYTDYTDSYDGTPFYQGNMKIGFFTDQLQVYTGKFEDFNAGYVEDSYVLGAQNSRYLASSSEGQYFTAVEINPFSVNALRGLKLIAGLPILPGGGNGVNGDIESNQWENLYKQVKLAAQYELTGVGIFNIGYRPGTFYTGVESYSSTNFTHNYFSEGYIQAVLPELISGVKLNFIYDARFRQTTYTKTDGTTSDEALKMAHSAGLSAELSMIPNFVLGVEDRFYYADDDYIGSDEKLLADVLAVKGYYTLSENWGFGFDVAGLYAADALGTAFTKTGTDAYFDGFGYDDYSLESDAFSSVTKGESTMYIGAYVNPYVQYNFGTSYIKMGVNASYGYASGKTDAQAFSYSVPVGLVVQF